MNKKPDNTANLIKNNRSFYSTLILCTVIFLLSIAFLIISFNRLISQHDERLSSEICTLLTEKMNNSLRFMTDSAKDISGVLSAQDFKDLGTIYKELSADKNSDYVGIGFIDEDGTLYATPAERSEFSKWSLLSAASYSQDITISLPYRSTTIGQPVITLFTPFTYNGGKQGTMFVTYRLSNLQDIVNTESLTDEIEIWLMNAESANMIQCVGTAHYAIGSWTNAYLSMQDINDEYKAAYDSWHKSMV
ncbi:MAG: cache domain-containing protein, partial [Lachnospiraceae bacterium]|nr:cache domain-containing protein [Lachnospiraceae bacterium]